MKQALSILFSLMLVLTQPFSGSGVATDTAPCCSCNKVQCCVGDANRPAQKTPAVPNASSAQKDFQIIVSPVFLTLTLPQISDSHTASHAAVFFIARPVPLFARDCAFLI